MQSDRPAGGAAVLGQLLLRWGFTVLGAVAGWLGVDRINEWSRSLATNFESDMGLWLQALGLFLLAGLLFGAALWLPVFGRGVRASVLLGLGLPILLVTIGYTIVFQVGFADLPGFLQSRVLAHPLLSVFAISFAPLLLGLAIVASFPPVGHVPSGRAQEPPDDRATRDPRRPG